MTSLRFRIALLLILAIVSVVGLATFAASRTMRPPPPEATMEPLARQLAMMAALARTDRNAAVAAGLILQDAPDSGLPEKRMTEVLNRALGNIGLSAPVVITREPQTPVLLASVDLGTGEWLVSGIPDMRPPPGMWRTLVAWMALIVAGTAGVALYAASKITRPLELLQDAAGNVGRDGVLPPLAVTGPAEVRATALAINQLSVRLKTAMESRMRLVAAAGHDLRTPMTRMRLRAEFITDEGQRAKWLDDLEELDAIADSAIRLVREEADSDGVATMRLDRLTGGIVRELTEMDYAVAAHDMPPLDVRAAPVALTRALRNLIINAATHGKGANVRLERCGANAVLTVTDSGPGIPDELLGRVFEPFFRVDAARRKTVPGAGLGLAIAREIIERQGGSIAIRNNRPTGLVQTVTLPLYDETTG